MKILLTGVAGFIGSNLADKLLDFNYEVVGVDNFDNYYSRAIKKNNLLKAIDNSNFTLIEDNICNPEFWKSLSGIQFDMIIHLAAKAGVRPSMADPVGYNLTNVIGTTYLLEFAKSNKVRKVIFASSSSVYGVNKNLPWSVDDRNLQPISIYASSKISGEQLCYLYNLHYGINIVGLRFFTVFGPRQRPDLAIYKFVKLISNRQTVQMYGNGQTFRDYTYIDDIVNGIIGAVNYENKGFELFNLGNTHTVSLLSLVEIIEEVLGKKADIEFLAEQPGDVPYTWSDIEKSKKLLNYNPETGIKEGIERFVNWYKNI